jgi:transcriptional regulator with XRE-family HTH domain
MSRPSQIAAGRIRDLRRKRPWTQQQLSDRLMELGLPMDRAAIAKVEAGQRGLPLDEAFAFALALDVAPVNLFLPLDLDEAVTVAPKVTATSREARHWVRGDSPIDDRSGEVQKRYFTEAPDSEWRARMVVTGGSITESHERGES